MGCCSSGAKGDKEEDERGITAKESCDDKTWQSDDKEVSNPLGSRIENGDGTKIKSPQSENQRSPQNPTSVVNNNTTSERVTSPNDQQQLQQQSSPQDISLTPASSNLPITQLSTSAHRKEPSQVPGLSTVLSGTSNWGMSVSMSGDSASGADIYDDKKIRLNRWLDRVPIEEVPCCPKATGDAEFSVENIETNKMMVAKIYRQQYEEAASKNRQPCPSPHFSGNINNEEEK